MRVKLLTSFLLFSGLLFGQLKPVGSWTDHLPYRKGTSVASNNGIIYCGTTTGLFTYNTKDNSISKFSKANILNDVGISKIAYSERTNYLIVIYDNANIDLITSNRVINLPFITSSNESPKEINEITIVDQFAYLSMGFGVVKLDLEKQEIVETYKFGAGGTSLNINDLAIFQNRIYAATDNGLFSANESSNLLDFNNWRKSGLAANRLVSSVFLAENQLGFTFNNNPNSDSTYLFDGQSKTAVQPLSGIKIKAFQKNGDDSFTAISGTNIISLDASLNLIEELATNYDAIIATVKVGNRFFLFDNVTPLVEIDNSTADIIGVMRPDGPAENSSKDSENSIFDMDFKDGNLWAVNGAHSFSYGNTNSNTQIYHYDGNRWESFATTVENNLAGAYDMISVTIDPENGRNVFFGSWGEGLYQYKNNAPFKLFRDTNSSLHDRPAWPGWIGAGEGVFDEDGNFWVVNTRNKKILSVLQTNGLWKSFDFSELITNSEKVSYDLLVDDNGYKWITLPRANEILVFDDGGTINDESDDRSILLNSSLGFGNIPGTRGIKIEKDKDGVIWIGTSDGVAVHFNSANVFESGSKDFERIIIPDPENPQTNEAVLKNVFIKDMAIDGANRKWIGTESGGVILLSSDGKEELLKFTEENSPLLSNTINAISIDQQTGEVYIATAKGLISYRSNSTEAEENFSSVKVFPNPVRKSYGGNITIQGLLTNTTLKITDANGNLVNEVVSEGGTASWNGKNINGNRVPTGVYLIFMSGEDEEGSLKTEVGKIMFIN